MLMNAYSFCAAVSILFKVEDNHSGSKIWQNLAFFNSINFPFLRHPFLGIKAPLGVKMPHLSKNGQ